MAIQHRRFKLAPNRKKYVEGREDTTLRGDPVRANPQDVNRYAMMVVNETEMMMTEVESQVLALFNTKTAHESIQKTTVVKSLVDEGMVMDGVAMDASIAAMSIKLTNAIIKKWTKKFKVFGQVWTASMIDNVDKASARDLKRSMSKLSGGLTIKTDQLSGKTRDKILASAEQASSLITTIGPEYAVDIKQAVARAISAESSSFKQLQENIHSMLNEKHKKYKNKAFNVANDQMRKSYTAVTTSRMQDIGVDKYEWKWAGGGKTARPYHRDVLNGKIFSLSNPPVIDLKTGERGKPADSYFCRCYLVPIISFDNKE